ncbi:recombination protein O N-terminal domain-containing protein [Candidatus Gracilibacteria bacterium]|nr:recombination protein O N-terminal domain-containing protein [Candidatus Gracilibacteria bacterium]
MAIEKYVTNCFVLESYDQSEHDRVYKLFTREFGLITAHAKSIRKLESKLRAHILPRSVSLVTLVQGREVWRLVGAEEQFMYEHGIHEATALLKRFIRGEGEHKVLYDRLIQFLKTTKNYDVKMVRVLLYYIFLVELGYADAKVIGAKNFKEYSTWSVDDLYTHLLLSYENVRSHVQEVMKEMQL